MKEEDVLKIRKLVKELKKIRGRHTELVTVYVPAGGNLQDSINQIKSEESTASNIKSKTTRKNVLAALEKVVQHLKLFRQTPPNGLAIFCGNISEVEGKEDYKIWSFEPPEKMERKLYHCDQVFVLDPLEDMISEKEVYGLIVLDAHEATIGLLRGKKIILLKNIEGNVPSKTVKGGMCLSPDTLVQLSDGRIVEVKDMKKEDNPIKSADLVSYKTIDARHNDIMERNANEFLEIRTKGPEMEITLTPEHRVFVPGKEGFEIKFASDLKVGDNLLTVKKLNIDGQIPEFNSKFLEHDGNKMRLLYQMLGYILGDGTKDTNRIILYDSDEEIADMYRKLSELLFKINTGKRFRKSKGTFEVKIYSKDLMDDIDKNFKGIFSTPRHVNQIFHTLDKKLLSSFIMGLFDAEGYVDTSGKTVGITMSSEEVIRILQLFLLRFGIINSYSRDESEYSILGGPKKTYIKHRVRISDYDSLCAFQNQIGFGSKRKTGMLKEILKENKLQSNTKHVPVDGRYIRLLAEEMGMNTENFPRVQDFFYNKKRQGFPTFNKQVLKFFEKRFDEIKKSKDNHLKQKAENIMKLLKSISEGDLILTHVKEINKIREKDKAYDISIPSTQNFIANGIVVHNSQGRYDRLREDAVNLFMNKIGDISAETLLKQNIIGLIMGGPGPVKDKFVKENYLNYQLQNKILGVKDIGYTGEYGLEELVNKSQDLLEQAAITKEIEIMKNFFTEIQKNGKVIYGYTETLKALNLGAVETLLISEDFDWIRVKFECQNGHKIEKDIPKKIIEMQVCDKCNTKLHAADQDEIGELMVEKAIVSGAEVKFISLDTREGQQFKELGGVGAFLRYKLDKIE